MQEMSGSSDAARITVKYSASSYGTLVQNDRSLRTTVSQFSNERPDTTDRMPDGVRKSRKVIYADLNCLLGALKKKEGKGRSEKNSRRYGPGMCARLDGVSAIDTGESAGYTLYMVYA